jgi:aryl-alcohol dehydrogenase-like predicted oxidoreductase
MGTASFGIPGGYPPHSRSPRPTHAEAGLMLDYAWHHGIVHFDTAAAYGDAEDLCEQYLRMNVRVTTKSAPEFYYTKLALETRQRHHGIHDWAVLLHNPTIEELQIAADGASVYTVAEARASIAAGHRWLQIPFHVLDQSHAKAGVFEAAKAADCQVMARQPFARGLLLLDPVVAGDSCWPDDDERADEAMRDIGSYQCICRAHGLSYVEAALRFSLESRADLVVLGVSSMAQLIENINIAKSEPPPQWAECYSELLGTFADSRLALASVCTP